MKPFLSLIVSWLAIGLGIQCLAGRTPNVLLIMADDVGLEPIGCYGGESFNTPQVDALASKGMRFEHCYSMPVCHPSRLAPGRPLDGQSFANSFRGNEGPRRAYAFSESRGKQCFVRDQRWKLYANGKMFDLKNDPAEKKALPEKSEETEAQRIKARLTQALDKLNFK